MNKILTALQGYKTYVVATAGVAVGVLMILGITTPDQLAKWGEVIGQGIVLAGLGLAALRSAIDKATFQKTGVPTVVHVTVPTVSIPAVVAPTNTAPRGAFITPPPTDTPNTVINS